MFVSLYPLNNWSSRVLNVPQVGDNLVGLDWTIGKSEPVKQPPSKVERQSKCASSGLTKCLMFCELFFFYKKK